MENKINWYPGHMKKATDNIIKKIDDVDFVIEVLDSRDINLTSNVELIKLTKNKPIIKIALKQDLSDIYEFSGVLIGSTKDNHFKNIVVKKLESLFLDKIASLKKKGLVKPNFIGMVIGIPNIGKSSLINFLAPKKNLITENRAGVTKKQTTKKINDNFYLIDTPGVLVKKIDNDIDGYKLSILNCISKKVMPMDKILKFAYEYMKDKYLNPMEHYFNMELKDMAFDKFIMEIANDKKFILENNEIDENRLYEYLFNIFSESKICKFHF